MATAQIWHQYTATCTHADKTQKWAAFEFVYRGKTKAVSCSFGPYDSIPSPGDTRQIRFYGTGYSGFWAVVP